MPNPTTNKAGIGELIATIGTIGEHMLCMLPLDTLAARDLVGNVAALAYTGVNGTQTGYSPTLVDDINGPAGVTAPYYRFGPSDRALLFKGRGFPSITYPMTLAITFKLNVDVTASGTIPIFAANSEVSLFAWGLSIQLNGSTIQLGLSRSLAGSGFHSAGASGLLTNGHWYSVSLTLVSASGAGSRVWNLYDHDTQTQTTQWSTSDTAAPSATAGYLDAVLNPGVVSSAAFASSFCGDVYAACLHTETWDSGTTAWFAGWFADPTACAKGAAYAPDAGTFTAGAANTLGSTATVIRLHAAHPIHGGSGGTLSYQ